MRKLKWRMFHVCMSSQEGLQTRCRQAYVELLRVDTRAGNEPSRSFTLHLPAVSIGIVALWFLHCESASWCFQQGEGPSFTASWHLHPRPGRSAFINICINLAVLNLQQGNIRGGAEWDDGPHCKQGQSRFSCDKVLRRLWAWTQHFTM